MKILIVDDESLARKRLQSLLQDKALQEMQLEVVAEAGNGEEGLALALEHKPDVILLDIRMPGLDGLQVARHLSSMGEAPAIVFATAYDEHALAAFDAHAIGYLLKPVRLEKLVDSLRHASHLTVKQTASLKADNLAEQRDRFCIKKRGQLTMIPIQDIRYFMADQKYVSLCTFKDGEWYENIIDDTLKELESEFSTAFLRVHRNALVARQYVEKLTRNSEGQYYVHLSDLDEPISVSRRQVKEVKSLLKN